jgi:STE24 endopeptidase
MAKFLFILIVIILAGDYLLDRILRYLNRSRWSEILPAELEGIITHKEYIKSKEYYHVNDTFETVVSSFSFILIMLMLFSGGFALLDRWVRGITEHPIGMGLLYFGILLFAFDILNIPFEIYHIFVIEERFGFNKTTPKTYILDKFKGWLITAILGGGILSLVIWFYLLTDSLFWIWAWILAGLFMIFLALFYSTLIVPLFNKQTPLEPGELRNEIEVFCEKVGFRLNNIFVMDGSRRTTKANAYFSGLGRKRRIILFDTLVNQLDREEIVAVLSHEIGHYKHKHTLQGMLVGIGQTGLTLFILSLFINYPPLSMALKVSQPSFHIGLICFGILYQPISLLLALGLNFLSRKNEYIADHYAAIHGKAESLSAALKKLSVKQLSNMNPHPAYVFFHYSHPPLLYRLKALGGKY